MSDRKLSWAALAVAGVLAAGCASSSENAMKDDLTANVGRYDPAPRGVNKPRIGIPAFSVKQAGGGNDLDDLAADQMVTLINSSERFDVIERVQLQQLLDEQHLQGIVKAGELTPQGQIRGVDYLLLGKVTNLRVKSESKERGFGLAQIGGSYFNVGGADVKKKDVVVTTDCGVDIRMVDPKDGRVRWSASSEYKKVDSAGALGIDILGASATADADLQISEDDKGKILRLALDDAVRKALPKVDKFLKSADNTASADASAAPGGSAGLTGTPTAGTVAPAAGSASAKPAGATATAAKKFCPQCGMEIAPGVKFCPHDGTKIE